MQSGFATQPIKDIDAYRDALKQTVVKSEFLIRPVFEATTNSAWRIVFSEGEDERVLHVAQAVLEETSEVAIVIGRTKVIQQRYERLGLDIRPDRNFNIVNPKRDDRYRDYWTSYDTLLARSGVSPDLTKSITRTNTTAIGAVMVHRGEADSLISDAVGEFRWHLNYIEQILGSKTLSPSGALSLIFLEDGPLFIANTHVWADPNPLQIPQTAK